MSEFKLRSAKQLSFWRHLRLVYQSLVNRGGQRVARRLSMLRTVGCEYRPLAESLETRTLLAASFPEFADPNPNPGNQFGAQVVPLSTGNVVVTSPNDDAGGQDAGAVYLFNGQTGALISTLTGASPNDQIGSYGIVALETGNFVIRSPLVDRGAATDAGAVTFGNGTTGVSGIVDSGNSLVGSTANDYVGSSGVTALSNGNYLVRSSFWDNGAATNAGAVTFGSGTTGVTGIVSASNSLVGSTTNDNVGSYGVIALDNGNYVVFSTVWDNGAATDAGAVTFGNGTTGVSGVVSASNSLVGSTANDNVGGSGITVLSNGNYVVRSTAWDNGAATNAGAVTFGNGITGVSGVVSASNSLVGSTANDNVGSNGVIALDNGNYVVNSSNWDNGAATNAGAVTFGNGITGVSGAVSASNSLVGSTANDTVGIFGITVLSNGNYVVRSGNWNNGAATYAGAVTFGSGTTGVSGVVSASNSLVGATANDNVGSYGVIALDNGNYVVNSFNWDNGAATNAGAVTFGSGITGVSGAVSASNSLVGSTANDNVGSFGVTPLENGNYVVRSPNWDNGAATNAGAVTFGNGTTGISGVVNTSNSLVGSTTDDFVGRFGVTVLNNGNYVVRSASWNNGAVAGAGAVTFGNGTTGVTGAVSASNSLVGSTTNDFVGGAGVIALSNGNYVVLSSSWTNGAAAGAGAVTFGSGTTGISGVVSDSNSLVGTTAYDGVGSSGITALSNGNYVVGSSAWDNGAVAGAGAVTFGNGTTGVSGVVSASNSLVGTSAGDNVGDSGVLPLTNGNYVVRSPIWNNGAATDAGAVTFGNGTTGVSGAVSASNSLVGSTTSDNLGNGGVVALSNGNYLVRSTNWDNGAATNTGAVTFGNGTTGVSGAVSAANSLVGLTASTSLQPVVVDEVNEHYFARFASEDNGKVRLGSTLDGLAAPDLAVFVNDTPAPSGAGKSSTFVVTVANFGPDEAIAATLSNVVAFTGGPYNSFDISNVSFGVTGSGTGSVVWNNGIPGVTNLGLSPGSQARLTFDITATFGTGDITVNSTVANATDSDPNTNNNTASEAFAVVNQPPTVSLGITQGTASIPGPGNRLTTNATYSDPDATSLNGVKAIAQFSSAWVSLDRLWLVDDNGNRLSDGDPLIVGGQNVGTVVRSQYGVQVLFNANATAATVQTVFNRIEFQSLSTVASPQFLVPRTIQFLVIDALGATNSKLFTLNIQRVNTAPQLTLGNTQGLARIPGPGVRLTSNATFSDPDAANLNGVRAIVQFASAWVSLDRLWLQNDAGQRLADGDPLIVSGQNVGTVVRSQYGVQVLFNGNATANTVRTIFNRIEFQSLATAAAPQYLGPRTLEFVVIDADGGSTSRQFTLETRRVNIAPQLSLANMQGTATVPGPAVRLTTNATFSDFDAPNYNGVTAIVQFDSAYVSLDRLWLLGDNGQRLNNGDPLIVDGVNVGAVIASQYGVHVTFNGNATPATVQAVFNRVEFQSLATTAAPQYLGQRTLEFRVVDAYFARASKLFTLNVQQGNSAPQLALGNTQGAATLPGPAVTLTSNATFSDPDGPNLNGVRAIVQFDSAYVSLDRLWLLDDNSQRLSDGDMLVIGGTNVGTVVRSQYGVQVLFNGNATATTVRTVFNRIQYQSLATTSSPQLLGTRTLEFRVVDAAGASASRLFTLNVS